MQFICHVIHKAKIWGAFAFAAIALAGHDVFAADPHAKSGDYKEVDGLPQLDFTTYPAQIFWMFIIFGVMYLFFSRKTLPEISATIEDRREKIQEDRDASEKLKEEAEEVHQAYDDILINAQHESTKRFKATDEKNKKKMEKKLQAFRDRSTKQITEMEKNIVKAQEEAMNDMQSIAAETASIAAEKIIGISTDIDDVKTVVKSIDRKAA